MRTTNFKFEKFIFRNWIYILLVALVLLAWQGYLAYVGLLALGIFAFFVAIRFPLLTIIGYLFVGVFPSLFQMTSIFSEEIGYIGGGVFAVDLVFLLMLAAVFFQIFRDPWLQKKMKSFNGTLVLFFIFWIFFEIIRNIGVYGVSAPGEFRYRYLILALPLYISVFFEEANARKNLLKVAIVASLFLPFLMVPFVGFLKGWHIGADSRYFPSQISLGLLFGVIAYYLAVKYQLVRNNPLFLWLTLFGVFALVVVDSHRSVWLAGFIGILVLISYNEIPIKRLLIYIIPAFIIIVLLGGAFSGLGSDLLDYVVTRGRDFFTPTQEGSTFAWRLEQWQFQLQKFTQSPIWGEGFGGYWGVNRVSPHNFYVQTLVKLGGVGMLGYLFIVLCQFFLLNKRFKNQKQIKSTDDIIVILALITLFMSHAYYFAYPFDPYSLIFFGLGSAVLLHNQSNSITA